MDDHLISSQIAFVLVRPKVAGNIGAAARALKNMGFADLRIVAPRAAVGARAAKDMAVHAGDLLQKAPRYDHLQDALEDVSITVGTTARGGLYRSKALGLRQCATMLTAEAGDNRIAILFGPEDHGLNNEELKLCQRLITIETSSRYKSINLAQSVMLVAYELAMALRHKENLPSGREQTRQADFVRREAMLQRLEHALVTIGFLPEENPNHIMFALRGIFGRSGLDQRECDILSGMAHHVEWLVKGGSEAIAAKRRIGRKLR